MKKMTLYNIAAACGGEFRGEPSLLGREAAGVTLDSRKAAKDFLFVATKGRRVDGHSFLPEVFRKGVLCAVCEQEPQTPCGPYILVRSSFQALKDIAGFYRRQLPVKVIGITGSVGKTSTKEMTASVLSQRYNVLKTEGNFNNEVGLPLTIFRLREEHEAAVLEMGISDFGEMHRLSEIARPDICVITNIGQCHLENLKSRDGVLRAKSEIFDFLKPKGAVCLNGDDDKLSAIREVRGITPLFFGVENHGIPLDVMARNIVGKGLKGTSCTICTKESAFDVDIPLPGPHMVLNALGAAAAGLKAGLNPGEIKAGIEAVKPLGGRSNLIETDRYTILDDCYNANPVSMRAAMDLLSLAEGRRVAILGDMGELGEDSRELHRQTGAYAALSGADVLLFAGEQAVLMYEEAQKQAGGQNKKPLLRYFQTREELLDGLDKILKQGDTILVKASHMMGFDKVVERFSS